MQLRRRGFVSKLNKMSSRPFEQLEARQMMCLDHVMAAANVVEERPDLPFSRGGSGDAGEPADIVWVNRANSTAAGADDTDGFGARFGTSAPLARAVVDAVITSYERMIGSFNYSTAGATYSLTVNMGASGGGFGASAGLGTSLGGKPKSGTITMGAGNGSANANDDNGWFLDPTPSDSAEFLGTIVNAYSGNGSVSPANTRSDFYTVVAAEMTHCMGLFGNSLAGWANLTTNTGIADTAEAGSANTSGARGTFWVFNGPSVKHLMTGNNGGSGGSNFGSAVHSAGPATITFNGDTYVGGQDQGNAVYEQGRRYTVNNIFALMFKDAYGYSTVDPARDGTFYSILNTTTGALTVRGAASSNDNISITRSGSTITVSVDIQNDVAGTGALPGAGDLPAFVSVYDASTINTITIGADTGDDNITIDASLGKNVNLSGSGGTDTLTIVGGTGSQAMGYTFGGNVTFGANTLAMNTVETVVFNGGDDVDSLTLVGSGAADNLTVNGGVVTGLGVNISYANIESLALSGAAANDTITLIAPTAATTVTADSGIDTLTVSETLATAPVTILSTAGNFNLSINTDSVGLASVLANADQSLVSLTLGEGASLSGTGNVTVVSALNIAGGSISGPGTLTIASGATFTASGATTKTLARRTVSSAALSVTDGTLVLPSGLSTTSPALITTGLDIGAAATLDINDNSLVIDYTATSPIAAISAALASGYAAGAWTGLGIRSSTAAASGGTRSIGYGEANAIFQGAFPATFSNVSVDATSVLIRSTIPGDANLDGSVGFDDLLLLTQFYGQSNQTWAQGNLNYDATGNVDFDDLLIVSQNYGTSLAVARRTAKRTARASVIA